MTRIETAITTAARRIARETGTADFAAECIQFDIDGKVIARPWVSDRLPYDAITATKRLTQREAQDLLDAHAAGLAAAATAAEYSMYEADAYTMAVSGFHMDLQDARAEQARLDRIDAR